MFSAGSLLLWWNGFGWAFALTCVIEVPVYLIAFRLLGWWRPTGALSTRAVVALALGVNLITHPVLWAVALRLDRVSSLLLAELGVATVEAALIAAVVSRLPEPGDRRTRVGWAFLTAAGVNAWSVLIGAWVLPVLMAR